VEAVLSLSESSGVGPEPEGEVAGRRGVFLLSLRTRASSKTDY
jgi:hypothetical protein